jgi:hypothetical protein
MPIAKVAYVAHCPGHRNSKGELAEWCVKSHKDDHIISSHTSEAKAKKHLQDMHAHSGSLKSAATTSINALDPFTRAYIQAALWSSTDDGGTPLDSKYDIDDIAPDTLKAMIEDCKQFQQQNAAILTGCNRGSGEYTEDSAAGHDFWLTRCGHGAGFWDGDWPENGDALTAASKKFGDADLYVGDDGYIYQYGKETPGPVPPRDSFEESLTPEDRNFMESMKVNGALKTAVYVEEQWEDILQKKGYVIDETTETPWEDTLYINSNFPDAQVLLHQSGEPYYIVELNGEMLEQDTDPEKLWDVLSRVPELYRKSIKHPRELNETDMKEMGILAHVKSGLLRSQEPKLAFEFDRQAERQYEYEANGNDAVLISPSNTTKLLQGDEANNFWIALDQIEDETTEVPQEEYLKRVQDLVRSYFDREVKAASKRYVIQVDATNLKRGSITFISGVEYKSGRVVEKLKFTTKQEKAAHFQHAEALKIKAQLPDFRLGGLVKEL